MYHVDLWNALLLCNYDGSVKLLVWAARAVFSGDSSFRLVYGDSSFRLV